MSPESRSYAAPPLGKLKTWGLIAVVVGIAGVSIGFLFDPGNLARAALIGGVYWVGISLGCLGLLMIQHLTGGDWGVVLRRVLEAGAKAVVLPVLVLVPVFLFGMEALYPWVHFDPEAGHGGAIHEPVEESDVASLAPAETGRRDSDPAESHGVAKYVADNLDFMEHKAPYLNLPGFWLRFAGYVVIWLLLAYWLWGLSKKQDERPDPRINKRAQAISAPGLILLALSASFASYDWLMSIFPTWYSTMYGVWFIGTCGIGALSILVLMGAFLAKREPLSHVLQPRHFHDWGKLLFAFVVLWAYFSVSQFLIIWSGNLPDEIAYFLPRFRSAQRFFIISEMRLRASADILRRLRPGVPASGAAGRAPAALRPRRARSFDACAVNAFSRSRVCAISRSSPPRAQPITSADLNSTSFGFLPGRPRGMQPPLCGNGVPVVPLLAALNGYHSVNPGGVAEPDRAHCACGC